MKIFLKQLFANTNSFEILRFFFYEFFSYFFAKICFWAFFIRSSRKTFKEQIIPRQQYPKVQNLRVTSLTRIQRNFFSRMCLLTAVLRFRTSGIGRSIMWLPPSIDWDHFWPVTNNNSVILVITEKALIWKWTNFTNTYLYLTWLIFLIVMNFNLNLLYLYIFTGNNYCFLNIMSLI